MKQHGLELDWKNIPSKCKSNEFVCLQDVIVHIRDISHPDAVAQKANVLQTLRQQNVDTKLFDDMIEVCNKVDKLPSR